MKKRLFIARIIALGAFLCALIFLSCTTAFAKVDVLTELEDTCDIVICIRYEAAEPSVTFISPDNRLYSADSDFDKVERTAGATYYTIRDAGRGTWKMDYDLRGNKSITSAVTPLPSVISLSEFTVQQTDADRISVTIVPVCEKELYFDYYLYAALDNGSAASGKSLEIKKSSGRTDREIEQTFSTEDLPDGRYHMEAEFVVTEGDTEYPYFFSSHDSFQVTGHTSEEAEKPELIWDLTDNILEADWSQLSVGRGERELTFAMNGAQTPELSYELEDSTENYSVLLDEAWTRIDAVLTVKQSNGKYLRYTQNIDRSETIDTEFLTPEFTAQTKGNLRFDCKGREMPAELTVNDSSRTLVLRDDGILSFDLDGMNTNEVSLRYSPREGVSFRTSMRISVDNIPPEIALFGTGDRIIADGKSVDIAGKTEPGARLTADGAEVNVAEDGSFRAAIAAGSEEKNVIFLAKDEAGNETQRLLTVVPGGVAKSLRFSADELPLWLLSLVVSMILLLSILVAELIAMGRTQAAGASGMGQVKSAGPAGMGQMETMGTSGAGQMQAMAPAMEKSVKWKALLKGITFGLMLVSAAAAAYFYWLYFRLQERLSGSRLPETLRNYSAGEVTKMLNQMESYKKYMMIAGIAAIVLLALWIVELVTGRKSKKRTGERNHQAPQ